MASNERVRLSGGELREGLKVVILKAGVANELDFSPAALAQAVALFEGAPCFIDHAGPLDEGRAGGRSVRDLAGRIAGARYDVVSQAIVGQLVLASHADWVRELAGELGAEPFLGLSADLWVRRKGKEVEGIAQVNSVDVVVNPAAGGRFLGNQSFTQRKEQWIAMSEDQVQRVQTAAGASCTAPEATVNQASGDDNTPRSMGQEAAPLTPESALANELRSLREEVLELKLARAGLPAALAEAARAQVRLASAHAPQTSADLDSMIDGLRRAWAEANARDSIRNLGQVGEMVTPLDKVTLAFERLMGLPETAEHARAARLTGLRELYDLLTGDWERHGLFHPERVTLANATTTTLNSVVADVLNKVLLRSYESRPQWWKPIAYEEDFQTMNTIRWITLGGFGDLDTVAEGNAYTEKTVVDNEETASFLKKGNYLGITLEMIDRDDVAAVRSIPRRLGLAAYRTLSAAVAALFTANAGVGPTLSDSKALFHVDHGNLGTGALSATSWDAVIQAIWQQQELGSSKPLGIRPRYCLVPIELEKTALTIFESDLEPGTPNNDANVRRNSSAVITVPDWSDANDWAAACDPGALEGVCIGYRFGRAPEIFVADSDLMGSMFTNDEMRVKCRFVFAVGVGDYRALYKCNVT